MNIVSAVANLQKELDYYKDVAKEQAEIIKQLVEGPGEFEYIHPHDLGVLLEARNSSELGQGPELKSCTIFEIDGKKYKQSAYAPVKTKSIR
jgi:hypothetical protein